MKLAGELDRGGLIGGWMAARRLVLTVATLHCVAVASVWAETVRLTGVSLVAPSATANRIQLAVDGGLVLGRDTDQADVSGTLDLDLTFDRGSMQVSELTVVGGAVAVTDTHLQLLGGLIKLNTSQVAGHPSTIVPPGLVSGTQFDAAQHQIVFDQGQLNFASRSDDLANDPIVAVGQGTGDIELTSVSGEPAGGSRWRLDVRVPIQLEELFDLVDNGDGPKIKLTVAGTLTGRTEFDLPPLGMPCDIDLDRDVDSADLLQLIAGWTGSLDPGQGAATAGDGDCDADGDVDSSDLASLLGEWTGALTAVRSSNVVSGQSAGVRQLAAVPEPGGALTWIVALAGCAAVRRFGRGSTVSCGE